MEVRNLALEMNDFIRQVGNAGDALEDFVARLTGQPAKAEEESQKSKVESRKSESNPLPTTSYPLPSEKPKSYVKTEEENMYDYITKTLKQPAYLVPQLSEFIKKSRGSTDTTGIISAPQILPDDPESEAKNLTNELVQRKQTNLQLQGYTTQQEREGLNIQADNVIETNKRQIEQAIKDNARNLINLDDTFADIKSQYDYPSEANNTDKELRGIKARFLDINSDVDLKIRDTEDNIKTIDNLSKNSPEIIARLKEIGTPEALKSIETLNSGLSTLQSQRKELDTYLTELRKLKDPNQPGNLAEKEKQAKGFTTDQGKLKVEIEAANKRNNLLQVKSNIAAQRGTIEQQRKLKILEEEERLRIRIAEIELNQKPGEERDNLINAERRQSQINQENINYQARLDEFDKMRKLIDLDAGINEKKAGFLSRIGFNFQASKLQRDSAIAQENNRYQKELVEIEKQYKGQPELLEKFKVRAEELNRVNLEAINQQFKDLKTSIEDAGIAAVQGFFQNVALNFFDGKAEQDRAYMEERLRYAEELVSLENQYKEDPGHLAHLKNRVRELNEQKLDKIKNEFNVFNRVINLAGQALLEFTKQLAAMAAQYAAAKFMSSIVKNFAAPAINAKYGATVPNYSDGGRVVNPIAAAVLANSVPSVRSAFRREGRQGVLGVFTPGEEILSIKTGEAGRYQALKRRYGVDPLKALGSRYEVVGSRYGKNLLPTTYYPLPNYSQGGTIPDVNSSILSGFNSSRPRIDLSGISEVRSQKSEVRRTVNVHTTVVTPNADSFRLNQDQMNQDLVERMRRGI
jgi:CII-binding regulator of phage lambda lysogenization HflD